MREHSRTSRFRASPASSQCHVRAASAGGAVLILVMRGLPDVPSSTVVKLLGRRIADR
nr:hypothetical protein OG999_25490 [Streptomyces sp. NBC_00886]